MAGATWVGSVDPVYGVNAIIHGNVPPWEDTEAYDACWCSGQPAVFRAQLVADEIFFALSGGRRVLSADFQVRIWAALSYAPTCGGNTRSEVVFPMKDLHSEADGVPHWSSAAIEFRTDAPGYLHVPVALGSIGTFAPESPVWAEFESVSVLLSLPWRVVGPTGLTVLGDDQAHVEMRRGVPCGDTQCSYNYAGPRYACLAPHVWYKFELGQGIAYSGGASVRGDSEGNGYAEFDAVPYIRVLINWRPLALGDVNNDGLVNFDDVEAFVATMTLSPVEFESTYPNWVRCAADMNQDGDVDLDDIDGFVAALMGW